MNETLKVINNHRSIRKYQVKQLPDTDLQTILEAAVLAPSARNQQKWHFTVIQNKDMLDRMVATIKENIMKSDNEFLKERASDPGYHTFYHAPTVILISGAEESIYIEIDCGAAAENIALAAASLNIGSCLLTSPNFLFTSAKGKEFKRALDIPEGYNHICSVALGYIDGDNPTPPPKNKDVVNYIK